MDGRKLVTESSRELFKPAIIAGHGDPAIQWMVRSFSQNITLTIVVRGLRAPPKPATFKQRAGHGDPAIQWMVRS